MARALARAVTEEKTRQKGREGKFERVCGWREVREKMYERKQVKGGMKDEAVSKMIEF